MTRKEKYFSELFRAFCGLGLLLLSLFNGITAEVRRDQFSKGDLDYLGYPIDSLLATELGRSEARRDLTNGIVRFPTYGLPAPWSGEYHRILKGKYQVESFGLAGCIVSQGLIDYSSGYSEVSQKHIEAKYGTNLWQDVRSQAEAAWAKKQAKKPERSLERGEYRIRGGDTLIRIAREHSMTLKALTEANPNIDPIKLKIGQVIRIPEQNQR